MNKSIPANIADQILDATIYITLMEAPDVSQAQGGDKHREIEISQSLVRGEKSLGSLVKIDNKVVVVTHDHWDLLEKAGKAQFHNADHEFLLEISGMAFRNLIRFRDEGTMVLGVPTDLYPDNLRLEVELGGIDIKRVPVPGSITKIHEVQVSNRLLAARRNREKKDRVEVIAMKVQSFSELDGIDMIVLENMSGKDLMFGDSGGGVWFNGKLIGNHLARGYTPRRTVRSLLTGKKTNTSAELSIAAQIPKFLSIRPRIPTHQNGQSKRSLPAHKNASPTKAPPPPTSRHPQPPAMYPTPGTHSPSPASPSTSP